MGGASFRRVATALTLLLAVALLAGTAGAQTATFTGRVTSSAGQPLGGASIGIADLGIGGVTDQDGRYTFTVDLAGGRTGRTVNVLAKYIGYKPKRLPVTLNSGRVEHNFELEKDVLSLEEASQYLAIERATLVALADERLIPCLRQDGGWVFSKKSIDKWRSQQSTRG